MLIRTQNQDPTTAMDSVSPTSLFTGFIYQWSITKVWPIKGRYNTVATSNHRKQWISIDVPAKYGS